MPRTDGVSLSSTVCLMRRSPRLFTTASWFRLNPIGLLRRVTLTVPAPFESVLSLAMVFSYSAPGQHFYFAPGPHSRRLPPLVPSLAALIRCDFLLSLR